jgi:hypothetical protein
MAYTSALMGLKVWNSPSDLFNYVDLADNWANIEAHNHNGTNSQALAAGSVGATQISNLSVGTGHIVDSAVSANKIAASSINYTKMVTQPRVRMWNNMAGTQPTNTLVTISWSATSSGALPTYDVGSPSPMWASGTPTQIFCRVAGVYMITLSLSWAAGPLNDQTGREVWVYKNDVSFAKHVIGRASDTYVASHALTVVHPLVVGDAITVKARHFAASNISFDPGVTNHIGLTWLGP